MAFKSFDEAIITKKQIRMIKTLQRKNLDEDDYYAMLDGRFGVKSCKDLTLRQAGSLIDLFADWGFFVPSPQPRRKPENRRKPIPRKGNVIGLAGPREFEKIAAVAKLIEWRFKDGLQRWILQRFKIQKVRTSRDAYLVIEGLKKMFENKMRKLRGDDWWMHKFSDPKIKRYVEEHCPAEYRSFCGGLDED